MSRKRRAKQRDIQIGDHVFVRNRRSGSKFLLPFEKDPWVAVSMASGGMEMEQSFPPASVFDDDDEGSVDFCNRHSLLLNPRMVVDEPLLADQEGADMQSPEVTQRPDQGLPQSPPIGSLPSRRGLEQYNLRPCPPRSTRLKGFVAD
ncbi:hypothetical protein NDU88_003529 [Pleurodeles waltl]|uniref:Uncharacterized protein n=1 Tax=Pleurodeles waltl TaxID=8319 RepID=A0AAV7WRX4_PLEWA|nr:hypothetical protein NDU88_003529 [Pleurodeles waltl]